MDRRVCEYCVEVIEDESVHGQGICVFIGNNKVCELCKQELDGFFRHGNGVCTCTEVLPAIIDSPVNSSCSSTEDECGAQKVDAVPQYEKDREHILQQVHQEAVQERDNELYIGEFRASIKNHGSGKFGLYVFVNNEKRHIAGTWKSREEIESFKYQLEANELDCLLKFAPSKKTLQNMLNPAKDLEELNRMGITEIECMTSWIEKGTYYF